MPHSLQNQARSLLGTMQQFLGGRVCAHSVLLSGCYCFWFTPSEGREIMKYFGLKGLSHFMRSKNKQIYYGMSIRDISIRRVLSIRSYNQDVSSSTACKVETVIPWSLKTEHKMNLYIFPKGENSNNNNKKKPVVAVTYELVAFC